MRPPKIDNVRVHVWTKSELNATEKQLIAAGYKLEKKGDIHYAYDTNVWGDQICILNALIGFPNGRVTVRVNAEYFVYTDEN